MIIKYYATNLDPSSTDVLIGLDGYLNQAAIEVRTVEVPQMQYRHTLNLTMGRIDESAVMPNYAVISGMTSAPFDRVCYFLTPALDMAETVLAWHFTAAIDAWHTLFGGGNRADGSLVLPLLRGMLMRSNAGDRFTGSGQIATEPEKPFSFPSDWRVNYDAVTVVGSYATADTTPKRFMLLFQPTDQLTGENGIMSAISRAHDVIGKTVTVGTAISYEVDSLLAINILPAAVFAAAPPNIIAGPAWANQGVYDVRMLLDALYFTREISFETGDLQTVRLFGNQTLHFTIPPTARPLSGAYAAFVDAPTSTVSLQLIFGDEKMDLTPSTAVSIYTPGSAEEQVAAQIRDFTAIAASASGSAATIAGGAAAGAKLGAAVNPVVGGIVGGVVGGIVGAANLGETITGVQARKDGMVIQSNSQGVTSCFYSFAGVSTFTGIISIVKVNAINVGAIQEELRLYGWLTGGISIDRIDIDGGGHVYYQIVHPLIPLQADEFLRTEVQAMFERGIRIWDVRADPLSYMTRWF